jgi:HEAT repeat protein
VESVVSTHSFEQLLAALKDPDWRIRSRAIEDLGLLRDLRAFDVVVEALADPELSVRQAATAALGQLAAQARAEPFAPAIASEAARGTI